MNPKPLTLILLTVATLACTDLMARSDNHAVVWERDAAKAAITGSEQQAMSRIMMDLTITGASLDLLTLLETTRTRSDWPEPARDATVFAYVENLRELPPGVMDRDIMSYLKAYPATTLVRHDDHPYGLVPLFNIRAAASGVENGWKREEALLEGLALLRSNPQSLADAFALEEDNAVRDGYRRALTQAQPEALASLNQAAGMRLTESPELTELFAQAASFSGDIDAHRVVIQSGKGAPVATMLREFSVQADRPEQRTLLLESLTNGHNDNTPLVLAELAPSLVGDLLVDQALIDALGEPALGASAALALSRSSAPETLKALQSLAQSGSSPAAARARMALELRQEFSARARS